MLNKYLKLLFIAGLQILSLPRILSAASPVKLPPECSGLDLIKGDPNLAKTVLYGEPHRDINCYREIFKCTQALAKKVKRSKRAAVVEGWSRGHETSCADDPDRKLEEIFDECYGWDLTLDERKDSILSRFLALKQIRENLGKELTYCTDNERDVNKVNNMLDKLIADIKQQKEKALFDHDVMFEEYQETHPKSLRSNFFSTRLTFIQEADFVMNILIKMKKQVAAGVPFSEVYEIEITQKSNAFTKKGIKISRMFITDRNKFIPETILRVGKNKDKVFVYAGKEHLAPEEQYKELGLVNELYKDLDKFADENPYAVLSCR